MDNPVLESLRRRMAEIGSGSVESAGGLRADASAPSGTPTEPDIGSPVDDPEYLRAKKRAFNMLGARAHSASELRAKLVRKEHPPEVVDVLIDRLTASGLLDDADYAREFVRSRRSSRALSTKALRRELSTKGITGRDAESALAGLEDEDGVALEVARKKARSTRGLPEDTRMRRVLGMLARRGFDHGVAMKAARTAIAED